MQTIYAVKTLAAAKEKHGSELGHEFDTLQMTKSAKIEGSKYMRSMLLKLLRLN